MQVLTISHPSEAPRAFTLAESVREFHPDWTVTAAFIGQPAAPAPEGVSTVDVGDFGVPDLDFVTAALGRDEQIEAVLGPVLRELLERDERVIYLDRRMRAIGPLGDLERSLEQSPVVLVPYETDAPEGGKLGSLVEQSESRGVFHPGVIGMRRSDESSAVIAAWPSRALAVPPRDDRAAVDDHAGRLDPFRAWLDSLPTRAQGVAPLLTPAFVAGAWNINGNVAAADGGLTISGSRMSLLDLSDFDPDRPHLLASGDDAPKLSESPALVELCARHARQIKDTPAPPAEEDPGTHLADGTRLTPMLRWLAAEAIDKGAVTEPLTGDEGMEQFYAFLNEPASRGAGAGLNRYHEAIWSERLDLRGAYPHLDGPDGPGFAGWLHVYGREQANIPEALLPPKPAHVEHPDALPVEPLAWGVNVAGFFRSELGLGEAARLLMGALDAAKVPALPVQGSLIPPTRQGAEFAFARPDHVPFPINIVCMNGDAIPVFAREAGTDFFTGRYSIALWWWELGSFPEDWHAAFDYIDEVWVASDHVYKAIAPTSPVPVVKVPMPVIVPRIEPFSRSELGMPEDGFVFLYIYDYHSTAARKNPVGLVRAFKQAFPPGSGASLVLKCINAENRPEHHEEVLVEIGDHPDIHIIDAFVTAAQKDALVDNCDCYVSLHRSEGFGLTPAEAMWLGKPVIATRYGGTLEFMTPENSYLVDHKPIKVGKHAEPYPEDEIWADPDIDQAARLMREVFDDQESAKARGRRAYEDIRATNAPAVAGDAIAARLRTIYDRLPDANRMDLAGAMRSIIDQPDPPVAGEGRRRRLERKVRTLRAKLRRKLMRHNRRVNEATHTALAELERQQLAAHAETLGGFRRTRAEIEDLRRQVATLTKQLEQHQAHSRTGEPASANDGHDDDRADG